MAVNPLVPWSLQQAVDRGFSWYPIEITNFGDAGATNPDTETAIDPLQISEYPIKGIRIAADSMAARCALIFNAGQTIVSAGGRAAPVNHIVLTHEQPWVGSVAAPLSVQALLGQMYFDTYTTEDGTATAPFGFAFAQTGLFEFPNLKLDLVLSGSGISATKRAPYELIDQDFVLTGGGTEDTVIIVPCDGRKRARFCVTNLSTNAGVMSYRVTMVNMRSPVLPAFVQRSVEAEVIASTNIAMGATDTAIIDPVVGDYLLLKISDPQADLAHFSVRLED